MLMERSISILENPSPVNQSAPVLHAPRERRYCHDLPSRGFPRALNQLDAQPDIEGTTTKRAMALTHQVSPSA